MASLHVPPSGFPLRIGLKTISVHIIRRLNNCNILSWIADEVSPFPLLLELLDCCGHCCAFSLNSENNSLNYLPFCWQTLSRRHRRSFCCTTCHHLFFLLQIVTVTAKLLAEDDSAVTSTSSGVFSYPCGGLLLQSCRPFCQLCIQTFPH